MKFKKALLPLFAGALALSLAACGSENKKENKQDDTSDANASIEETQKKLDAQLIEEDKIVAVVNGEELTGKLYNIILQNLQLELQDNGQDPTSDKMIEQLKTATLETLVDQTALLQQAKAEQLEVTQEEIDAEYALFVTQFGGEETLNKALKDEGIDAATIKETIGESILFQKYQNKVAPIEDVSDEEIQQYYDEFTAQSEGEDELPTLEELSDNIKTFIQEANQREKFSAHIKELREAAEVELKM